MKTALLAGIGNVLLGDDGIGPYVVRHLEAQYSFGENVEVVDIGTPALDFTHRIADRHALILVDSVTNDDPPGTVVLFRKSDVMRETLAPRLDPHSPALSECLMTAEMLGSTPEHVLLIGVAGDCFEIGSPISERVRQSVGLAVEAIIRELDRLGFSYQKKPFPDEPGIWWAETPARHLPAHS